jgi:hypothetical protein
MLCGLDFGRQKKLDITHLVCGGCKSELTQTKPVPKVMGGKENKVNPFGMFVKEHFASVKRDNPGSPHKDIMGILSKLYKENKEKGAGMSGSGHKDIETILVESDEEVENVATTFDSLEL